MDSREELKNKMATAISILQWELADMWGHVSVRAPDGHRFLLRHLRPPLDPKVPADDVLEYDLDGRLVSGKRDQPDEIFFYACPFKEKQGVGAVIHCHPQAAISLIAAGKKVLPIHQHSIRFGRGVPVSPWLYGFWPEHGNRAVKAMGENCALLIKGHGALVTGRTLEEACINMVYLERTAKMILMASQVGEVSAVSPAVVKKYSSVVGTRSKGQKEQMGPRAPLEWQYFELMIRKGERWSRW
jgi:ribulose-5-phosphate 4-epimerase/fuculose-1-phosphate aldolase